MLEHAISPREVSKLNYPIVSPALFKKNKGNYVNQLFYCPKCNQCYCFGYNQVDNPCRSCYWVEHVKDACLKRYGDIEMRMIPKEKPCHACLAKESESVGYLLKKAAEKRKAKIKRTELRRPAKLRRLERRKERRVRQREKSATIIPFREPVTPKEAVKFLKRNNSSSPSGKSNFKKKPNRIGPRTGRQPWQQSPSMRYAC